MWCKENNNNNRRKSSWICIFICRRTSCICTIVSVSVSAFASIEVHFSVLFYFSLFLELWLCPFLSVIRFALFWKWLFFFFCYCLSLFVLTSSRFLAFSGWLCFTLPLLKHYLLLCKQASTHILFQFHFFSRTFRYFFTQFQFLFHFGSFFWAAAATVGVFGSCACGCGHIIW